MQTIFTRRQIETTLAAFLAAIAAIVGLSDRSNEVILGPKVLKVERIGRFNQPVHLAQPPGVDSPLFVVERPGRVKVIDDGNVRPVPFLDLRNQVKHAGKGGEQGMLSIAFAPDYNQSRLFYVAYTDKSDALRVVEFRRSAETAFRANKKSGRLVLSIPQPTTKHHGGLLLFGPDKLLYIGSGDGGPSRDVGNRAQNKRILLGKILRIDPRQGPLAPTPEPKPTKKGSKGRKGGEGKTAGAAKPAPYTIPRDNPLVGRPGRDEIYAYGLRNPWRFSFDPSPSGDLLTIGDVGDDRFEEVNILPLSKARGANFGWSAYEGDVVLNGGVKKSRTVLPVHTYPHGRRCSIVGGYIVRDPRLSRIRGREVVGSYIYGDFCSQRVFAFRPRPNKVGRERSFRFRLPGVTSFGKDRAGRIYVLTYQGAVFRLDPTRKRISN